MDEDNANIVAALMRRRSIDANDAMSAVNPTALGPRLPNAPLRLRVGAHLHDAYGVQQARDMNAMARDVPTYQQAMGARDDHVRSERDLRPFNEAYVRGFARPIGINPYNGKQETANPEVLGGRFLSTLGDIVHGRNSVTDNEARLGGAGAAGFAATGGMMASRPKGSVGTFGGIRAKTADLEALSRAEAYEKMGHAPESIWPRTGWFRHHDGNWRFEIDDSKASLNLDKKEYDGIAKELMDYNEGLRWYEKLKVPESVHHGLDTLYELFGREPGVGAPKPLMDRLNHPDLYAAYPDLKSLNSTINVIGDQGFKPSPFQNKRYATIDPVSSVTEMKTTPLSSLMHEVGGHAVQQVEGFAGGSSPGRIKRKDPGASEAEAYDLYHRNSGEVEARLVQKRLNLTAEQRRARPPWYDYDVHPYDQIVEK